MTQRFDVVPLSATITEDGYIHDTPVLTRTGIFQYRDPATGKMRSEFRPASEVFHVDSLASMRGKPITNDHPGKVGANNFRLHGIGTVLSAGRQDGDNLLADIVIHDPTPVTAGKRELSLGYDIELDETPGEFNGQRYDAVQRNIRVNHLAIVKAGRAGNSRLNMDAAELEPNNSQEAPLAETRLVEVRLDGISYQCSPEVQVALDKLRADAATAITRADTAQAGADAATAKLDAAVAAHKTEVATLRADAVDAARARLDLEEKAKAYKVDFKADASDKDLQIGIIKAVRGDSFDPAGRSDAYIAASYDVALETAPGKDPIAEQRRAMNGGDGTRKDNRDDGLTAYERHVKSLEHAWKGAA